MAATNNAICFRVPKNLRRRVDRLGQIDFKSVSEMARESFRLYVERREKELGLPPVNGLNGHRKAVEA